MLWTDTSDFFSILNWKKTITFCVNRLVNESKCNFKYSNLCCCFESSIEIQRPCTGIQNSTGLGSNQCVVSHDTFLSSYMTCLLLSGVSFHHRFLLLADSLAVSLRFQCSTVIKTLLKPTWIISTSSFFILPICHDAFKAFQVTLF